MSERENTVKKLFRMEIDPDKVLVREGSSVNETIGVYLAQIGMRMMTAGFDEDTYLEIQTDNSVKCGEVWWELIENDDLSETSD